MIVKQATPPKKFDPITIVLETETEAKLMWVALNICERDFNACAERQVVDVRSWDGHCKMFCRYDAIFNPIVKRP
jgi:hypothetical protein